MKQHIRENCDLDSQDVETSKPNSAPCLLKAATRYSAKSFGVGVQEHSILLKSGRNAEHSGINARKASSKLPSHSALRFKVSRDAGRARDSRRSGESEVVYLPKSTRPETSLCLSDTKSCRFTIAGNSSSPSISHPESSVSSVRLSRESEYLHKHRCIFGKLHVHPETQAVPVVFPEICHRLANDKKSISMYGS
jgi:hypothetical protein